MSVKLPSPLSGLNLSVLAAAVALLLNGCATPAGVEGVATKAPAPAAASAPTAASSFTPMAKGVAAPAGEASGPTPGAAKPPVDPTVPKPFADVI